MKFNLSLFEIIFGQFVPEESNIFGKVLIITHTIILTTVAVIYFYQLVINIISLLGPRKKFKAAKQNHKYIIVTSARNEEHIIPQFVATIKNLNYDQNLLEIHVIADNCTDNTAEVARNLGATVFERNDLTKIGKSYALSHYFNEINDKYLDYAGFIILDTDNLLEQNYLNEINKVFDSENANVIAAYRASTNFGKSLWSFGTGYAFLRECTLMHNGREKIGLSSYISGTGFFVSRTKMLEEQGWNYFTFIEDIEFSLNQALQNVKIHYAHDAIFYDEQPTRLKYSWRQRMRWVKGLYQCTSQYSGALFRAIFKKGSNAQQRFSAFEALVFVLPIPTIIVGWYLLFGLLSLVNLALGASVTYVFLTFGLSLIDFTFSFYVFTTVMSLIITFFNWKRIKMNPILKIVYPFFAFFYLLTYVPILIIAIFKKVEWKPIPHYGTPE